MRESKSTLVVGVPLVAEAMAEALSNSDANYVVRWVHHDEDVSSTVCALQPDLLLVAWNSGRGRAWVEGAARSPVQVRVVALGVPNERAQVVACLEAGACDWLPSDAGFDSLCNKVDAVLAGRNQLPADIVYAMTHRLSALARERRRGTIPLTERELEILRLIDLGMSNKEIATSLKRSLHTIKNHVHHILEKLEVPTRQKAAHWYRSRIG